MSAPIGPGDWVEVVKTAPPEAHLLRSIWRVANVGHLDGLPWVSVVGHPDPQGLPGWSAESFRPIYRPGETLIARLLEPLPADVEPVNA